MARKTLTDRLLKTLKTDAADSIVPGLAVRVGAAGQKTFVLVGRFPGRTNPTRLLERTGTDSWQARNDSCPGVSGTGR